jgi:hypothetical protein
MDTALIITGMINEYRVVVRLIQTYEHVKNKIISTWKYTHPSFIEALRDEGFICILNDPPPYIHTVNMQQVAIASGLLMAKEMGFKYCIRSRTDIYPNNYELFCEKTRALYTDKITVFTYFMGHICDFVVMGPTDEMLVFFSHQLESGDAGNELFLMEKYTGRKDLTQDECSKYVNYCLDICRENGIEHSWLRPGWPKEYMKEYPYIIIETEYFGQFIQL